MIKSQIMLNCFCWMVDKWVCGSEVFSSRTHPECSCSGILVNSSKLQSERRLQLQDLVPDEVFLYRNLRRTIPGCNLSEERQLLITVCLQVSWLNRNPLGSSFC